MSGCSVCGEQGQFQYSCNLCKQSHCTKHRLPESHDSPGLVVAKHLDQRWFRDGVSSGVSHPVFDHTEIPTEVLTDIADDLERPGESTTHRAERIEKVKEAIDLLSSDTQSPEDAFEGSILDDRVIENPENKPYTVVEPEYAVGTPVNPEYEPSPDVNPDGSLSTSNATEAPESQLPNQSRFSLVRLRYYAVKYGLYVVAVVGILLLYFYFS